MEPDLQKIRESFFKECTDFISSGGKLPKVNMAPHDLFEWFRQFLATPVWKEYDFNCIGKRPIRNIKYLVVRKDGKIHWEQWNGSGWAYNENVIKAFMDIPEVPAKFLSND